MGYVNAVLKKWYIVMLFAVLVSGGLYAEKAWVAPPVVAGNELYFSQTGILTPMIETADGNRGGSNDALNKAVSMWSNKSKFIDSMEAGFECEKLLRGWNELTFKEKTVWMDKHFVLNALGNGRYEFVLKFAVNEAKDDEYIKAEGDRLLRIYTLCVEKAASIFVSEPKMELVEEYHHFEEKNHVTETGLQKKYAIIGFVLGGLVGVAVVMGLEARGRREKRISDKERM